MNTQKDDTGAGVTAPFNWYRYFRNDLATLRYTETKYMRSKNPMNDRVYHAAMAHLRKDVARALHYLGGLASPW